MRGILALTTGLLILCAGASMAQGLSWSQDLSAEAAKVALSDKRASDKGPGEGFAAPIKAPGQSKAPNKLAPIEFRSFGKGELGDLTAFDEAAHAYFNSFATASLSISGEPSETEAASLTTSGASSQIVAASCPAFGASSQIVAASCRAVGAPPQTKPGASQIEAATIGMVQAETFQGQADQFERPRAEADDKPSSSKESYYSRGSAWVAPETPAALKPSSGEALAPSTAGALASIIGETSGPSAEAGLDRLSQAADAESFGRLSDKNAKAGQVISTWPPVSEDSAYEASFRGASPVKTGVSDANAAMVDALGAKAAKSRDFGSKGSISYNSGARIATPKSSGVTYAAKAKPSQISINGVRISENAPVHGLSEPQTLPKAPQNAESPLPKASEGKGSLLAKASEGNSPSPVKASAGDGLLADKVSERADSSLAGGLEREGGPLAKPGEQPRPSNASEKGDSEAKDSEIGNLKPGDSEIAVSASSSGEMVDWATKEGWAESGSAKPDSAKAISVKSEASSPDAASLHQSVTMEADGSSAVMKSLNKAVDRIIALAGASQAAMRSSQMPPLAQADGVSVGASGSYSSGGVSVSPSGGDAQGSYSSGGVSASPSGGDTSGPTSSGGVSASPSGGDAQGPSSSGGMPNMVKASQKNAPQGKASQENASQGKALAEDLTAIHEPANVLIGRALIGAEPASLGSLEASMASAQSEAPISSDSVEGVTPTSSQAAAAASTSVSKNGSQAHVQAGSKSGSKNGSQAPVQAASKSGSKNGSQAPVHVASKSSSKNGSQAPVQSVQAASNDGSQDVSQEALQGAAKRASEAADSGAGEKDGEESEGELDAVAERQRLYEETLNVLLPGTSKEIEAYMAATDQRNEARDSSPVGDMRSRTVRVRLEAGAPSQKVMATPNFATGMLFTDMEGRPWPIDSFVLGSGSMFNVEASGSNSNQLSVSPQTDHGQSNLIVALRDKDVPLVIKLSTVSSLKPGRDIDALVTFQVGEAGPSSPPPVLALSAPKEVDDVLYAILDGLVPKGGQILEAEPALEGERVVALGSSMYLRTNRSLIWPAARARVAGPGGVAVYEMLPVTTMVLSNGDETLDLKVPGADTDPAIYREVSR